MEEVDYTRALELLREVVAEEGEDFVYKTGRGPVNAPNCMYAFQGKGDCGVGRVLVKLGVPVKELEWTYIREGAYSVGTADMILNALEEDEVLSVTPEATLLLSNFQTLQDVGTPWGEALNASIKSVKGK